MSALVRFETGLKNIKARIFEQSSLKKTCVICKEEKRGTIVLLVRHLQPKKPDSAVCHECIVKLCLEPVIEKEVIESKPKAPAKKRGRGRPKKRGVKRGTVLPKIKCDHCDRKMPKGCIAQHMKAKHPEEYALTLIDNSIEESTDATVEGTEEAKAD